MRISIERFAREMILLVDASGSMQGASLEQAKAAVGEALDRLSDRAPSGNVRAARDWVAKREGRRRRGK